MYIYIIFTAENFFLQKLHAKMQKAKFTREFATEISTDSRNTVQLNFFFSSPTHYHFDLQLPSRSELTNRLTANTRLRINTNMAVISCWTNCLIQSRALYINPLTSIRSSTSTRIYCKY